jgi:nucleoid-associated protein YgaU
MADDKWDAKQYHEVKKGDTLWKIAEKYYGDGSLYTTIFEANKDILKNPDVIKIGQKLHIP